MRNLDYSVCHFSTPPADDPNLIVIVDEADEYVSKNACIFRADGQLDGLTRLRRAKRVFFVSATATDFLLDLADVLPDTNAKTFKREYLSKAEISTTTQRQCHLDKRYFRSEGEMLQGVLKDVAAKAI